MLQKEKSVHLYLWGFVLVRIKIRGPIPWFHHLDDGSFDIFVPETCKFKRSFSNNSGKKSNWTAPEITGNRCLTCIIFLGNKSLILKIIVYQTQTLHEKTDIKTRGHLIKIKQPECLSSQELNSSLVLAKDIYHVTWQNQWTKSTRFPHPTEGKNA